MSHLEELSSGVRLSRAIDARSRGASYFPNPNCCEPEICTVIPSAARAAVARYEQVEGPCAGFLRDDGGAGTNARSLDKSFLAQREERLLGMTV